MLFTSELQDAVSVALEKSESPFLVLPKNTPQMKKVIQAVWKELVP